MECLKDQNGKELTKYDIFCALYNYSARYHFIFTMTLIDWYSYEELASEYKKVFKLEN